MEDDAIGAAIRTFWAENLHGRFVHCGETLEIMTNAYLASLALEADKIVTKLGWVTLQGLASTFKLPVEVTLRVWYRETLLQRYSRATF